MTKKIRGRDSILGEIASCRCEMMNNEHIQTHLFTFSRKKYHPAGLSSHLWEKCCKRTNCRKICHVWGGGLWTLRSENGVEEEEATTATAAGNRYNLFMHCSEECKFKKHPKAIPSKQKAVIPHSTVWPENINIFWSKLWLQYICLYNVVYTQVNAFIRWSLNSIFIFLAFAKTRMHSNLPLKQFEVNLGISPWIKHLRNL